LLISNPDSTTTANDHETNKHPHIVHKLQLDRQMLSQDEIDLKRFLAGKQVIKKSEREFLLKYVIKGLPASLRGQFWLVTSGANRFMQKEYDPGYY
jgi:hypothetical protein